MFYDTVLPLFTLDRCAESLGRVRLFVTPWTVACQAPLSMGFFQGRILESIAISFSRESSQPSDQTMSLALQVDSLLSHLGSL